VYDHADVAEYLLMCACVVYCTAGQTITFCVATGYRRAHPITGGEASPPDRFCPRHTDISSPVPLWRCRRGAIVAHPANRLNDQGIR